MPDKPRNIGASVRARLLNLAQKNGTDFQLVLTRYVLERLLYRLGVSAYREKFVLKGAMIYALWVKDQFRNTRDLDLLAGHSQSETELVAAFREICSAPVPDDGVAFDIEKLTGVPIRAAMTYGGVQLTTTATVGGARVPVRIDIGFGDAVTPPPALVEYPVLLDHPPPHLMGYPRETVIAEKFEAMVSLGLTNSRMKDFHDVAVLAESFAFEGAVLADAIAATFRRRGTPVPSEAPLALTDAFIKRPETVALWKAFVVREAIAEAFADLNAVASLLRSFLLPPTTALTNGVQFGQPWKPGGPWREERKIRGANNLACCPNTVGE